MRFYNQPHAFYAEVAQYASRRSPSLKGSVWQPRPKAWEQDAP